MPLKLFLLYSKSLKNVKWPASSLFNKFYFAFGKFIDALRKKTAVVVSLQTVYSMFFHSQDVFCANLWSCSKVVAWSVCWKLIEYKAMLNVLWTRVVKMSY